jgi:hypothetical protein
MGTSTAKLPREKTMVSPTHPDIVEFMTLYEHIQSATKGKPDRIPFLYKNDPKFAELCRQIHHRVFVLNLVLAGCTPGAAFERVQRPLRKVLISIASFDICIL